MISPAELFQVRKVTTTEATDAQDMLAVEEPVEIRLVSGASTERKERSVSITMRTPGHDHDLAAGFLFTEGIIRGPVDILEIRGGGENITVVELRSEVNPSLEALDRHFYTTSSCGVCGKTSLDAVKVKSNFPVHKNSITITSSILHSLQEKLRGHQKVFDVTGGLHASALFNPNGELLIVREDVGRHNALDKVIGSSLIQNRIPLNDNILLLSGRISFELVQKAYMAGIPLVAAIGAPSTLAVTMAEEVGMTLVGFLRDNRYTVYSGKQRIH